MKHIAIFYSRSMPKFAQILISRFFSLIFHCRISTVFIPIYCRFFQLKKAYLEEFRPASGANNYQSFSDFFKRRLRNPFFLIGAMIWPCEGYVCDWGEFEEKEVTNLKGECLSLPQVFGLNGKEIKDYFFTNIFLHNHNYHRIHSPIDGTVEKIHRIPGGLVFLRPWFYDGKTRSFPALCNERVVIELKDSNQKSWWLALVGGFGVGTISIEPGIFAGSKIETGRELGHFELGSTVCMATPCHLKVDHYLEEIRAGSPLPIERPPIFQPPSIATNSPRAFELDSIDFI